MDLAAAGSRRIAIGLGLGLILAALSALALSATPAEAASRLDLDVKRTGARVLASYAPRERPIDLAVKLNGTRIDRGFEETAPVGRDIVLGVDEGLRPGRNVLVLRALFKDGRKLELRRRFEIGERRVLAGADGDERGLEGMALGLRARVAARGERERRARLSWRIVERPDGARARLEGRHSRHPQLEPDAPGAWRVALEVRRPGSGRGKGARPARVHQDVQTTIVGSATADRAGVPIFEPPGGGFPGAAPASIDLLDGGEGTSYPIGPDNGEAGPIATVIYDRCSLALEDGPLYTGADAASVNELKSAIATVQSDLADVGCEPLVVIGGWGYGQLGPLGSLLNDWASPTLHSDDTNPFWSIFVPPPQFSDLDVSGKGGWSNNPAFDLNYAGRMSGQLVLDQNDRYVFVPSPELTYGEQEMTFSMSPEGIEVPQEAFGGGTPDSYPAEEPGCSGGSDGGLGGFQVLVLGAGGPWAAQPYEGDQLFGQVGDTGVPNGSVFWTNPCQGTGEEWAEGITSLLDNAGCCGESEYPLLVFIQAVGEPFPTTTTQGSRQALAEVSAQIGEWGGSPGAFLNSSADKPGYSFAGINWDLPADARVPAEVTSTTPGSADPAAQTGHLRIDRQNRLAPSFSTTTTDDSDLDALEDFQAVPNSSAIVNANQQTLELEGRTEFPNEGNAGWDAAMYDFAKANEIKVLDPSELCRPAVLDQNSFPEQGFRGLYCGGTTATEFDSWREDLADWNYTQNGRYTLATFNAVKAQFDTEFEMMHRLASAVEAAQGIYTNDGLATYVDAQGAAKDVSSYLQQQETKADEAYTFTTDGLEIIASLANVGAAGTVNREGGWSNGLWMTQGIIDLGLSIATTVVDGLSVGGVVNGTSSKNNAYGIALVNMLEETSAAMDTPRDQIASDWGRLQAFFDYGLDFDTTDLSAAGSGLAAATYDRIWKTTIPGTFNPVNLPAMPSYGDPAPVDVPTWRCEDDDDPFPGPFTPFADFEPSTYALIGSLDADTGDNDTFLEAYALAFRFFTDDDYTPISAPADALDALFASVEVSQTIADPVVGTTVTPVGGSQDQFFADVLYSAKQGGSVTSAVAYPNTTDTTCELPD